jgi:hypothetical protein
MKIFKRYRKYLPKTIIGKFIKNVVFTNVYKIYAALLIAVIYGVFYALGSYIFDFNISDTTSNVLMFICLSPMVIIALIFFIYGFIINPIKSIYSK